MRLVPIKRLQTQSYSSSTTAVVPLLTHEKAGVRFGANISNLSISELKYTKSQAIATTVHRHVTLNCLLKCEKVANYRIYAVI